MPLKKLPENLVSGHLVFLNAVLVSKILFTQVLDYLVSIGTFVVIPQPYGEVSGILEKIL